MDVWMFEVNLKKMKKKKKIKKKQGNTVFIASLAHFMVDINDVINV